MPKLNSQFMNFRSTARLLALLACALILAPDLQAQRGGRGRGRGGKAKQSIKKALRNLIPKPLPPINTPKLSAEPKSKSPLPGSLLPTAEAALQAGSVAGTDIATPQERSFVIWTDPHDPELEEYYFSLCDHDSNTWISYREGIYSLSLDRLQFSYYDKDRDGRIQRSEFAARYNLVVNRKGGFPPPKPLITDVPQEFGLESSLMTEEGEQTSDEVQLLQRFDTNESGGLELGELPPMIKLWLLTDHVEPEQLMTAVDSDASSALELSEMAYLIKSLALAQFRFVGNSMSVESLLGIELTPAVVLTERAAPLTVTHSLEPKLHFDRLDQDGDGFVGSQDLRTLQAPMHLSVRTNAVIAAIDTDGDGKISTAEFTAAFE